MGVVVAVAWNLGVPSLFVLWLAIARDPRASAVIADVALALAACVAALLSGLWLAVPGWLILLPLLAILPAVWARVARGAHTAGREPTGLARLVPMAIRTVALAAVVWVTANALLARRALPGEPVALASPLPAGTWLVANGGSTSALNSHLRTLTGPPASEWRGQSYAVDLVAASAWGSRVSFGFHPELDDYRIFGTPVLAPCEGRVVIAHDGEPERADPSAPWQTRPGNHVVLECGEAWVLLAHLTTGSVLVEPGIDVGLGEPIGRVGNTGASGEPHLHVHAQAPGSELAPFGGTPYPITIDGRSLVRNDRLRPSAAPPGT